MKIRKKVIRLYFRKDLLQVAILSADMLFKKKLLDNKSKQWVEVKDDLYKIQSRMEKIKHRYINSNQKDKDVMIAFIDPELSVCQNIINKYKPHP